MTKILRNTYTFTGYFSLKLAEILVQPLFYYLKTYFTKESFKKYFTREMAFFEPHPLFLNVFIFSPTLPLTLCHSLNIDIFVCVYMDAKLNHVLSKQVENVKNCSFILYTRSVLQKRQMCINSPLWNYNYLDVVILLSKTYR